MKVVNFKLLALILSISLNSLYGKVETKKINLDSGALDFVDGKKGLMDEYVIRDIMYIGREVTKLHLGMPKPGSKQRVGKYSYDNRLWTLKELVKLEEDYRKSNKLNSLKKIFEVVTTDFRDITRPYLAVARANKKITLKLISDYCLKTNRPTSYLLRWADGHNNEKELFFANIKTFKDLDVFCSDLLSFLVTLVHNCPKGYQKYILWKEKFSKK